MAVYAYRLANGATRWFYILDLTNSATPTHSAVDDHTRLAYSAILPDETKKVRGRVLDA